MPKVSLLEFARTGNFGPLRAGNDRSKVLEVLGTPPTWGPSKETIDTAPIWKFGDFEFHFSGDYLFMIFTDWFEVPTGGNQIQLDPWILHAELMREDFEAALSNEGIPFTTAQTNTRTPKSLTSSPQPKRSLRFGKKKTITVPQGYARSATKIGANDPWLIEKRGSPGCL